MDFHGKFEPPAIGKLRPPIEIAGDGTCGVSEDGVKVTGTQSAATGWIYWLLFGVFLVSVFFIKIQFDPPDWAYYAILGAGISVVIGGGTALGKKRKLGKLVTLEIPWRSIAKFEADAEHPNTVVLTVKKFKPKGDLFFTPDKGAAEFLSALTEHKQS
ncbi:MAG TPA: hypothetical protein PKD61_33205 [Polyangiaceae bacterium]|nr:hypothetical protein [Polyangiaceae bacterium]